MLAAQRFEIFYDDPFEPLLIAEFDDLPAARSAMEHFASFVPGKYFVWSPVEDEIVTHLSNGSPLLRLLDGGAELEQGRKKGDRDRY